MTEIKRTYTIPLRRGYANTPRHQRTQKAVRVLRLFLEKHMKATEIKLGKQLNEHLWQNGIRNPPAKVKIVATKDNEGVVRVELEGKDYVDFKIVDKVDANQTFKEKLQNKVANAKTDVKPATAEKTEEVKTEKPAKETVKAKTEKPAAKEKAPTKKAEVKAKSTKN